METKQHTPSVIAKLMGLDELPPQQPIHRQQRVLSENYLRKTASIGLREKRSIKGNHSYRPNTDKHQEVKDIYEIPGILKKDKQNIQSTPEEKVNLTANKANKARRNILRSLQKFENGFVTESSGDFGYDYFKLLKSQSELKDGACHFPTRIVVLKPNIRKTKSASTSSYLLGSSEASTSEVDHPHVNECEFVMPSYASFFDWKNQKETSYSSSKGSFFAWEAKKRLLERWKITRTSQEIVTSSRGCTLGEMLSLPDLEVKPRISRNATGFKLRTRSEARNGRCLPLEELVAEGRKQKLCEEDNPKPRDVKFSSEKVRPTYINLGNDHTAQDRKVILVELESKLEAKHESEENLVVTELSSCNSPCSNSSNPASVSFIADVMADAETEDVGFSPRDTRKQQSEPTACNFLVKEGKSSHFWDASSGQLQESPVRSYDDELVCLNYMEINAEFPKSLGEAYQPSPNSVLEPPFKEDNSSGSEWCESVSTDLHGLWLQLQFLKSESEENHSEPGIVVSSDEDGTEKSFNSKVKNTKLIKFFGAEESRDFSYLVDVLEESGFHGGIMEINFERWHSPEHLASPSVFNSLEKKYGEQISWKKAERRLLFDRINSGLMEILRPCIDIHIYSKQLRKKMSTTMRRDVIEEELWTLLLSHGKELNKELSEKAVGKEKWLELADEVDSIAREVENFLFDELAVELVSI